MPFAGFPPAALDFYAGLEDDNSKAYFDAHREVYETCVREPLEDLVAESVAEFGPGKVFRPNRDVRFSPDKSPYKTHGYAVLGHVAGGAGYYVGISREGLHVGGGAYEVSRDQRDRYRAAVDRPRPGAQLERLCAELAAAGFSFIGPDLKRGPRGFAPDHPRMALLRRTRVAASRRYPPGADVHDPQRAREAVLGSWRALKPLLAWWDEHVGPALAPPRPAGGRRAVSAGASPR